MIGQTVECKINPFFSVLLLAMKLPTATGNKLTTVAERKFPAACAVSLLNYTHQAEGSLCIHDSGVMKSILRAECTERRGGRGQEKYQVTVSH